jgi:hypothetical protein
MTSPKMAMMKMAIPQRSQMSMLRAIE